MSPLLQPAASLRTLQKSCLLSLQHAVQVRNVVAVAPASAMRQGGHSGASGFLLPCTNVNQGIRVPVHSRSKTLSGCHDIFAKRVAHLA